MASTIHQRKATTKDRAVVASLARELALPVEEVEDAYLRELTKLETGARIKTFVSVLAAGNVRTHLRRAHGGHARPKGTNPAGRS